MSVSLPKALLISLRDPKDPMTAHEHRCFTERAQLPASNLIAHHMIDGPPSTDLLKAHDVLFFGGSGAFSVLDDQPWIGQFIDVLLRVLDLQIPSWASCFGFQGLAIGLGGRVIRDTEHTEMGSTLLHLTEAGKKDPLLSVLPEAFWGQEGHHDRIIECPPALTLLARGDFVREQATRVEGAPFWASQFHPELTVEETLYRFRYYQDHYIDRAEADKMHAQLNGGLETPEMSKILPRFVRGEY
ncbi:MAG: type 1 glutamine amidotransferase [Proteobacteria bacterium]|jgi:GMP synthase (glutamine-hydrolysing)|nr:type 1 glutamine amidotransferase [Pseudomonadota bacterium]